MAPPWGVKNYEIDSPLSWGSRPTNWLNDVNPRVVLVDGIELAGLMIDYGVGVSQYQTYPLSRLDEDYFIEVDS